MIGSMFKFFFLIFISLADFLDGSVGGKTNTTFSFHTAAQFLYKTLKEIETVAGISSVLRWDSQTMMPANAAPER
jgi:hypothetical protein